MQHRDGHVWGLQTRLVVGLGRGSKGREHEMGGCTGRGAWANQKVGTQVRVRLFGSTRRCGARGKCCGGEARPARLLLLRRERGREDLRLSRSWCDRCQRRRASGSQGVAARGSAGAGGGGCGVVSAAPELDINKACGECKQRAEEVAMGVRGLRRTSTVGAVGDKNNKRNGRPQAEHDDY